jgi:pyruvate/2-oxoglutarate dehydrogenase complex dihydrolipoamide acyltransferase (E2) component
LAKILVPGEAKGVAVGKLIGLLVEEKKDINTIDLSKYQGGQAEPAKKEAPKVASEAKAAQN